MDKGKKLIYGFIYLIITLVIASIKWHILLIVAIALVAVAGLTIMFWVIFHPEEAGKAGAILGYTKPSKPVNGN